MLISTFKRIYIFLRKSLDVQLTVLTRNNAQWPHSLFYHCNQYSILNGQLTRRNSTLKTKN